MLMTVRSVIETQNTTNNFSIDILDVPITDKPPLGTHLLINTVRSTDCVREDRATHYSLGIRTFDYTPVLTIQFSKVSYRQPGNGIVRHAYRYTLR